MKTNSRHVFNSVILFTLLAMCSSLFPALPAQAEALAGPLFASSDFLWAKSFGYTGADVGTNVVTDSNGNVYVTGQFAGLIDFDSGPGTANLTSAGYSYDIFILKLDNNGNFVWAKALGGTDFDFSYDITVDSSGNVYTVGTFRSTADFDPGPGTANLTSAGSSDISVTKLDGNGNLVWAKSMGGTTFDTSSGIAVDSSGNVYTTGSFLGTSDFDPGLGTANLTSVGDVDIFISKLDGNGNFVWAKRMGGTGAVYGDSSEDIVVDSNGSVYTTGFFEDTVDFDPGPGTTNLVSAGDDDIFISKLDTNGSFVWAKAMRGGCVEEGHGITLDSSGNIYTTGLFCATVDFDPGSGTANLTSAGETDIFVSKLDGNGNYLWAKRMGSADPTYWAESGLAIAVDSIGQVYTTGRFTTTADFDPGTGTANLISAGGEDIFVSKLDGNGNFVWAKSMGGTNDNDWGNGIAIDSSGNVFATGKFYGTADFDPSSGIANLTSAGDADIFVTKLGTTPPIFISGNAGIAGAILTYTDVTPTFVIADGSGNYSLSVPSGWSGTITPHAIGYSFTPPSKTYSDVQNNQTGENYTALDCPACADRDTTGVFRPSNGALYLKNLNITGYADVAINYGVGGDYPVVGDWDGDGIATIGIYRNGVFYLRNANTIGYADIVFAFGSPGDQPVAGDWNGDGIDTVGVYRSSAITFYLRNSNSAGAPDMSFSLGNPGDVGIAGDWNGDGFDTTGVFRPSNGALYLKNTNATGYADIAINYGLAGDQPVTGDWNNDGIDTIGIYRNGTFYLRNSNTIGYADLVFALGVPGDMPIAGNWDALP